MNPLQAHLILLLHELAHGPDVGADYGHFSEPGAGLLPTLAGLDAAQASAPVAAGRPPLAAFVAHLAQLLTFAADQLSGAAEFPDFAAPWQIQALDEAQWRALRQGLASAFAGIQAVMQRRELESEELNVAQSTLIHAASHAGAVRFQVQNILAGA
ncbi:hypothetical protein [Deinococcus sp.]|uniref:hypothetical protein n=1 Tax=Deinococcus sp. TaxID=47478 RepID=UPI00286D8FCE|nr:hypothetical protein [Deinococcus sp.]